LDFAVEVLKHVSSIKLINPMQGLTTRGQKWLTIHFKVTHIRFFFSFLSFFFLFFLFSRPFTITSNV